MIALADCNSFFASVERALHPGLKGKPVCVLSSNDGNIVALTTEAKALGLRRGDPYFKVKDLMEKNGVAVFSGNLMLYAAMSKRVQSIMRRTVAHTECYSIDEQFLYLDGYEMGTVDLVTHKEYVSDFRTDTKTTLLLMAALIGILIVLGFLTMVAGGGSLNLRRRSWSRRR